MVSETRNPSHQEITTPYPTKRLEAIRIVIHQVMALSEIQIGIRLVTGIYVKHILPGSPDPFGRHGDELEDEGSYSACLLQPEIAQWDTRQQELVEVVNERGHHQECGILRHERLWQMAPSEAVVHLIEYAFLATTQVVELHNFPCRGNIVVGKDASVSVFPLPDVEVSIGSPLALDDKAVCLPLPLFDQNGVQFEDLSVDFFPVPSPQVYSPLASNRTKILSSVSRWWKRTYALPSRFSIANARQGASSWMKEHAVARFWGRLDYL